MSCCEERPGKGKKSWAPPARTLIHLKAGFVAGVLFMLLVYVYLVVSQQQAAISGLGDVTPVKHRISDKQLVQGSVESDEKGKVVHNTNGYYSETCEVDGDVRINGTSLSVSLVPTTGRSSSSERRREWKIQPYSRKIVPGIKAVTVAQLPDKATAPACTATYTIPAVLFSLGGLTGNFWHDFNDVLVPLFIASRRYAGEVQFLTTNTEPWFLSAYTPILQRLTKYDAVDLDADAHVRCFPRVTVGVHMQRDLGIIPEWVPGSQRITMPDFTKFLREIYVLPRSSPTSPIREPGKKPRLLLIRRTHTRRFMNEEEVLRAAEAAGFEAAAADLRRDADKGVEGNAREVNTYDVVLGVHGAGLTNMLFLPPGGVLIQVVPYGRMEVISGLEYGEPAKGMGLRYLEYIVKAEESTLLELLGQEHPAIKDPESVHRSGWNNMTEFYLNKQSVRVDVKRFAPTLAQAFDHLRQQ